MPQILPGSKKTQKQLRGESFIFSEVSYLFPLVGGAKKQTSVFHSSTESEVVSLDTGLRMDGLFALDLWGIMIEKLRFTNNIVHPNH